MHFQRHNTQNKLRSPQRVQTADEPWCESSAGNGAYRGCQQSAGVRPCWPRGRHTTWPPVAEHTALYHRYRGRQLLIHLEQHTSITHEIRKLQDQLVSKMTRCHCMGTVQSCTGEGNGEKLALEARLEDTHQRCCSLWCSLANCLIHMQGHPERLSCQR